VMTARRRHDLLQAEAIRDCALDIIHNQEPIPDV
jgi:hypothetical protein